MSPEHQISSDPTVGSPFVVNFTTAMPVPQLLEWCVDCNWKKTVLQSKYCVGICLTRLSNYENPIRTASILPEIRTKHLPNTSLDRYRYTHLLRRHCDVFTK
jgi:hypothetical protein